MLIGLIKQWQQNVTIIKYIIHNIRICFDRRDNAVALFSLYLYALPLCTAPRAFIFSSTDALCFITLLLSARVINDLLASQWARYVSNQPSEQRRRALLLMRACIRLTRPQVYIRRAWLRQLARLFRFESILLLDDKEIKIGILQYWNIFTTYFPK